MLFRNSLNIPTDTQNYYSPAALSLVEGHGYTVSGIFLKAYPPFFPLFLAAVYRLTGQAGTVNVFYPYVAALLQSFSCGFVYLIAKLYFPNRTAVISALLLASYPFFMVLSVTQYVWNAMALFLFLFYPAIYLYLCENSKNQWRVLFFSGLLLGLACLVWPGGAFLWIPLSIFKFLKVPKTFLKKISVLIFITGFWIFPLLWHIYALKQSGQSIWFSGNSVSSMTDGLIHQEWSKLKKYEMSRDAETFHDQGRLQTASDFIVFYRKEISEKPKEAARFISYKLLRPWYATDSEKYENWTALIQAPYLILGMLGAVVLIKEKREPASFLILTICYFWLVSFSVLSILRYMIPAMGLIMILVPSGAELVFKRITRK